MGHRLGFQWFLILHFKHYQPRFWHPTFVPIADYVLVDRKGFGKFANTAFGLDCNVKDVHDQILSLKCLNGQHQSGSLA